MTDFLCDFVDLRDPKALGSALDARAAAFILTASRWNPILVLEMIHCASDRRATTAMLVPIRIAVAIGLLVLAATPIACNGEADRMAGIRALQDAGRFEDSIDALREVLAVTPELPEAN